MSTKQIVGRWPGRPPPLADETFSSWFHRVALVNGLTPTELFRAVLPNGRCYGMDWDRHVDPELLTILVASTGVTQERLLDVTCPR
jgi:hypothetical protein